MEYPDPTALARSLEEDLKNVDPDMPQAERLLKECRADLGWLYRAVTEMRGVGQAAVPGFEFHPNMNSVIPEHDHVVIGFYMLAAGKEGQLTLIYKRSQIRARYQQRDPTDLWRAFGRDEYEALGLWVKTAVADFLKTAHPESR